MYAFFHYLNHKLYIDKNKKWKNIYVHEPTFYGGKTTFSGIYGSAKCNVKCYILLITILFKAHLGEKSEWDSCWELPVSNWENSLELGNSFHSAIYSFAFSAVPAVPFILVYKCR